MASEKILGKESIELLCSLINRLTKVSEGINDEHLSNTETFSSVKIDEIVNQVRELCKDYTDEEIQKIRDVAIKVVDSMDKIVDEGVLYLYRNEGELSFSRYMFIAGNIIPIDNVTIDLSGYVEDEDFEEVVGTEELETEAKTLKGAINELKKAIGSDDDEDTCFLEVTQAEYDALIDKNDGIVRYITDKKIIVLNDIIYGVNTGNGNSVDIITSLDNTVTDEQIASAKCLNDIIGNETLKTTAITLKGAINELKEQLANGSDTTDRHQELTRAEYEVLSEQDKTDGMITFITDENIIILNKIEYGNGSGDDGGVAVYNDYSEFPTTIEEDVLVYAKNNYTIPSGATTYLSGLYLANATTGAYVLLTSSSDKVDWTDGINSKPFERLNSDHFEVDADDVLSIKDSIHDTINVKLTALEKAVEKSSSIDDTATDNANTWSAEKLINELAKKGSKDSEHTHDNMDIIKKFGEDNGLPTYNGGSFMTTAIYDVDNDGIVDKAKESEKLKDVTVTTTEINYLSGAKSNIQEQINALSTGVIFKGEYQTYAQMTNALSSPEKGWLVYILTDENTTHENVQYIYDGTQWVYGGGRSIVNEADDTTKGVIQLNGDLTGTSSSPQLVEVATAQTVSYIKGMEIDAKGRVLSITEDTTLAERIAKLEARPQIYVSATEPENMINGDIWIQI